MNTSSISQLIFEAALSDTAKKALKYGALGAAGAAALGGTGYLATHPEELEALKAAAANIPNKAAAGWDATTDALSRGWDAAGNQIGRGWDATTDAFGRGWDAAGNQIGRGWDATTDALSRGVDAASEQLAAIRAKIAQMMPGASNAQVEEVLRKYYDPEKSTRV